MKTFLQICQYISSMTNSGLASNIISLANVDNEQKNTINRALSTLWNETLTWNLRYKKTAFNTVIGQPNYPMVNGIIKDDGLRIAGNTFPLRNEPYYENITQSNGTPYRYWIEGDDIILDPIPSSIKVVTVKYRNEYPVLAGEVEQDFFVNSTDVLNIPARLEKYFIDCLGHLVNQMLNADQTDEEYAEHRDLYIKSLNILQKADLGTLDNSAGFIIFGR